VRRAVLFDVLGTLFSLEPLQRKLRAPALEAWFERLLHSATSLTLADGFEPFADLAESTLKTTIAKLGLKQDAKAILDVLNQLPPDPDAAAAFGRLERANMLIGVLTNSGERQTRKLLEASGLVDRVAEIVSAEEVELYRPHPAVYRHAAERLGVEPKGVMLIAAHAWDVVGAKQAGLDAVWVDRLEREWPFPRGKPRSRIAQDLLQAAELAAANR
jgi:2-haloacid dehalogenase